MKNLLAVCVAACFATSAFAAPAASTAPNAQQSKMKTCNNDAASMKGDERKAFMKQCLSAKPVSAPANSQQTKMKTCNADAAGKKGEERKAFMKQCLSASK